MDTEIIGEAGLVATSTRARALRLLELSSGLSTDAVQVSLAREQRDRCWHSHSHQMRVPHSRSALLASWVVDVPLKDDSTSGWA